jgi:hypothetical protein
VNNHFAEYAPETVRQLVVWLSNRRAIRRLYLNVPAKGQRLLIDEFGPPKLQRRHGHCLAAEAKRRGQ